MEILLVIILVILIALMYYFTFMAPNVAHFMPDTEIIDNSRDSSRPRVDYHGEDIVDPIEEMIMPFDYKNYKNTDNYQQYFVKVDKVPDAPFYSEKTQQELKKVKMGFTPQHDVLIGATSYDDQDLERENESPVTNYYN